MGEVVSRKEEYRERQAIVEHPFGHIKRNQGYSYTMLKGKGKVGGEFGLIFLVYNFLRAKNILGFEEMKKALKGLNYWIKELYDHVALYEVLPHQYARK